MTEELRPHPLGPVRLCCMRRHFGAVCPDGMVMCALCFDRYEPTELAVDSDGSRIDVCVPCFEREQEQLTRRQVPTCPHCHHPSDQQPGHFLSCSTIIEVTPRINLL